MRNILILLLGIVLGAMAAVPSMLFFLRSDAGLSVLRAYVAPQPEWPDVNVSSASNTSEVTKLASGAIVVGVPKIYAGAEYANAFNGVLREVATIATSSEKLVTLLTAINAKSLARDYNGLFDLVVEAKGFIAQQKASVGRFSQQLTALSAANQTTPDTQTKSLTQDFYNKGLAFQSSLEAYITALDGLLSGAIPTAAQMKDVETKVADTTQKGLAFSESMKQILARFSAGAQSGATAPQR
jgi:hypothetical protein